MRTLILAVAVGLFMAASGAFGSGEASPVVRFAYWVGVMLVGSLVGRGVAAVIGQARFERRPLAMAAVMVLAISLPMSLVVWLVTARTFGFPATWETLAWLFPPVLMVSAAMTILSGFIQPAPAAPMTTAAAAPPRFLERLPFKLKGAEIHAVQAEDHYLRVHTSMGSDLILMRLSDAIAELEGLEGAQTHRSWWVARGAILDVERGDGRAMLKLKGGIEAPVSRSHARALRQAQWW